jgi:hypothetical protein
VEDDTVVLLRAERAPFNGVRQPAIRSARPAGKMLGRMVESSQRDSGRGGDRETRSHDEIRDAPMLRAVAASALSTALFRVAG